ncbi:NADH dehydrogenase [Planctomycetaceae bacterium SCGC AG-212-F19]|nr:NADH dehydrogenase [Planctomycetaceae bacterium SCGC AG-212-F19]
MIAFLLLIPTAAGLAAFVLRSHAAQRTLLVATALAHAGLTLTAWFDPPGPMLDGWLALDSTGLVFLSITSVLFLAAAVYAVGYLRRERVRRREESAAEGLFAPYEPEAVFVGCLLLFLAAMTLVTVSQQFGLLWVAVEATTLASAPMIYFHKHHRSLEATWKYLLICSVGIALALLGTFLLAAAAAEPGRHGIPLIVGELVQHGKRLHVPTLKAAFLFFLVGYGTKMGLAPLHTWLPDAHSESPSLVSALLSGALLNCAFLAILRVFVVCVAAGQAAFAQELLVGFGLLSMGVAAVFIIGQADFKRMLAYSSVEHMGILALGVGLGGAGFFGSMLHAVNHSLTKAALFLVAGNILAVYQTKETGKVTGLRRLLPVSGALWLAGFFAITGSPPFGPFLSEFTILRAALVQGRGLVAVGYLAMLALIFIGMATIVLRMYQGAPNLPGTTPTAAEPLWSIAPSAILCGLVLLLGVWVPYGLRSVLEDAARTLGGHG